MSLLSQHRCYRPFTTFSSLPLQITSDTIFFRSLLTTLLPLSVVTSSNQTSHSLSRLNLPDTLINWYHSTRVPSIRISTFEQSAPLEDPADSLFCLRPCRCQPMHCSSSHGASDPPLPFASSLRQRRHSGDARRSLGCRSGAAWGSLGCLSDIAQTSLRRHSDDARMLLECRSDVILLETSIRLPNTASLTNLVNESTPSQLGASFDEPSSCSCDVPINALQYFMQVKLVRSGRLRRRSASPPSTFVRSMNALSSRRTPPLSVRSPALASPMWTRVGGHLGAADLRGSSRCRLPAMF